MVASKSNESELVIMCLGLKGGGWGFQSPAHCLLPGFIYIVRGITTELPFLDSLLQ